MLPGLLALHEIDDRGQVVFHGGVIVARKAVDHDGVIPVTNPRPAPPTRLDLVVSIGPKTLTETGSADEFGRVSSVALGPNQEVFVADRLNREIRAFGLDGTHLRTFGRMGEGPGEFQTLNSLAWAGDRELRSRPRPHRRVVGCGEWLDSDWCDRNP